MIQLGVLMTTFKLMTAVISISAVLMSGCAILPKAPIAISSLSDEEILAMLAASKAEEEAAKTAAETAATNTELTEAQNGWLDTMFAGVEDKMVTRGAPVVKRDAEDVTCIRYYANAVQYFNRPDRTGMVMGIARTMFAGVTGGVAAGVISEIGIGSEFLDSAISSSANQIVFQGADIGWNMIVGNNEQPADPMVPVMAWASDIGCPAPTDASMAAVNTLISSTSGNLGGLGAFGDVGSMTEKAVKSKAKGVAEDAGEKVVGSN